MGKPLDVCQRLGSPVNKVCVVGGGGGGVGVDEYSGFQVTGMIVWEQKNP